MQDAQNILKDEFEKGGWEIKAGQAARRIGRRDSDLA
jgi:hypothetical protein